MKSLNETDVCTYLINYSANHFFFSADGPPDIRLNIKFVQDTSKYWYKPEISREQGERFNISFHKLFYLNSCGVEPNTSVTGEGWSTLALEINFPAELMLPSCAVGVIINTSFLVGNWT